MLLFPKKKAERFCGEKKKEKKLKDFVAKMAENFQKFIEKFLENPFFKIKIYSTGQNEVRFGRFSCKMQNN